MNFLNFLALSEIVFFPKKLLLEVVSIFSKQEFLSLFKLFTKKDVLISESEGILINFFGIFSKFSSITESGTL